VRAKPRPDPLQVLADGMPLIQEIFQTLGEEVRILRQVPDAHTEITVAEYVFVDSPGLLAIGET
jgi:hypothetical protein